MSHTAEITDQLDGTFLVTCPYGCRLGTSAKQRTREGAKHRVALHEASTEISDGSWRHTSPPPVPLCEQPSAWNGTACLNRAKWRVGVGKRSIDKTRVCGRCLNAAVTAMEAAEGGQRKVTITIEAI